MIVDSQNGFFRPDEPITRAEYAALASSFAKLSTDVPNSFPDVPDSHWAVGYINSVAAKGWVNGFAEDGTFQPEGKITRAQLVTIVNRMLERKIELADIPGNVTRYTDITFAHWAYCDIMEASVAHEYTRKDNGAELWE